VAKKQTIVERVFGRGKVMMGRIITLWSVLFFAWGASWAQTEERIKRLDWNGIEVVWIEDNRLPLYNVVFYFADGALSDQVEGRGMVPSTEMMFSLLDRGTNSYSFKEISDNLEFYGTNYRPYVTHEYSTYSYSGLMKDIIPASKMICHLFRDATYPRDEVDNAKQLAISGKNNMVRAPDALASRVFRELSLSGSSYNYPFDGKIKDIKKIDRDELQTKLKYFNQKVYKKIYIAGPSDILQIKNIINDECGWQGRGGRFIRSGNYRQSKREKSEYYFIPVKGATAAYVRIGSLFGKENFFELAPLELSSTFLGGGFTSKLMQEIRVKRGLSYGISAFAARQKDYGRVGIVVSTDNAKIPELFSSLKDVFAEVLQGKFSEREFKAARGYLMGSYAFRFEQSSAYINQLLYLDHIGADASLVYQFPAMTKKTTKKEMVEVLKKLFSLNQQVIVVLGDPSLSTILKPIGDFKAVDFNDFL